MGFFSIIKETWEEVSYDIDNQFRTIGSIIRVKIKDGSYRYGIFCGRNKIVLAEGYKVFSCSYNAFNNDIGFFSSGWIQTVYFSGDMPVVGDSCKRAIEMLDKKTDMSNFEFAMFCRTGKKNGRYSDVSKSFSIESLKERGDQESYEKAIKDRESFRGQVIDKVLSEYNNNLLNHLTIDLNKNPYCKDDRVEIINGQVIVNSKAKNNLKYLNRALSKVKPRLRTPTIFTLQTSLKSRSKEKNKILTKAIEKYDESEGIYKGVCYLPKEDHFINDLVRHASSLNNG